MGEEISDVLKRGANDVWGLGQLEGEKGITPRFNKESKTGNVRMT